MVIERAKEQVGADGILTSDDLGMQTGPFFSLEIFDEFFRPYYMEMIDKAHSLDMEFWVHICGNIESFLPRFIEIGLDVIHPTGKRTLSRILARKFRHGGCARVR